VAFGGGGGGGGGGGLVSSVTQEPRHGQSAGHVWQSPDVEPVLTRKVRLRTHPKLELRVAAGRCEQVSVRVKREICHLAVVGKRQLGLFVRDWSVFRFFVNGTFESTARTYTYTYTYTTTQRLFALRFGERNGFGFVGVQRQRMR